MSAALPPDGYLSRRGAAALLGTYHQRVTAMIKRGDIEAFELNGQVLLREADVQIGRAHV